MRAWMALVLVACGTQAEMGEEDAGLTRGEVCEVVMGAACDRQAECGGDGPACLQTNLQPCCGVLCHLPAEVTGEEVMACVVEIQGLSCPTTVAVDLNRGQGPEGCRTNW